MKSLWPLALGVPALWVGGLVLPAVSGGQEAEPATAREAQLLEEVDRLERELEAVRQTCDREKEDLRRRLAQAHAERSAREYAWYEYNRTLARLELTDRVPTFPVDPAYGVMTLEEGEGEAAEAPLEDQLRRRAVEIQSRLRQFLLVEEIRGLDLLEVGRLDRGAVGPVVFRLLDDRGRLSGGLNAERLRLEASHAGHTVTLVLENGFESRAGQRLPFTGGVRRIVLPFVDPAPWIEALPELFPPSKLSAPVDDGRWDHRRLRNDLNELLRGAPSPGTYRLRHFDGVMLDELRGVHLEAFGPEGVLERRLFADTLTLSLEPGGVRILLTDGIVVRAGERMPFVDGTYRIYLPRVDRAAWEAVHLPGLSDPPGEEAGN